MEMLIILEQYFLLFMAYSFGGWIIEEIHCSIIEKKIVNRGFLIGPICPIYGFGGVLMTILLSKFIEYPIIVFCMAVIVSAILEYFTSYIMEKLFNARWWDYSKKKFNINGRICLETLVPFGTFGLLVIYILDPFILGVIQKMPDIEVNTISWTLAIITIIDTIISLKVVSKVTTAVKKISNQAPKDDTNEITELVKREIRRTKLGQRLIEAFPDFQTVKTKLKEAAKKTAQKSKEVIQKKLEKN